MYLDRAQPSAGRGTTWTKVWIVESDIGGKKATLREAQVAVVLAIADRCVTSDLALRSDRPKKGSAPLMVAVPIDLTTWPRRETLALFRRFQKPQYAVTARVDVTKILTRRADDETFSSYLACIHSIGTALHAVPELSLRIRGDQVVRHDSMLLSPTLQFADGRLGFTYLDWQPECDAFAAQSRRVIDETLAGGALRPGIDGDDGVAFLSCQPWLDFTSFDNPVFESDDSIPRICWGRYTPETTGRWTMAVALQVHHGLLDGVHVAQFFKAMQAAAYRF